MNDDAHTTSITATTASALSNNNGKLRKQTKPELIKTAGYANREKKKIKSQCNILKTQLKMQELEHAQALSKEKALLKDKSEQCKHLATLAQQHRRVRCPWLVHTTKVMANLACASLDCWRGPYHACQPSSFRVAGKPSLLFSTLRILGDWPFLST